MKIVVKKIPYKSMRYPSYGDYWMDKKGVMQVRISTPDTEDPMIDFYCYLIHELVEAFLTKNRFIDWDDIDKFDKESGLEDPGASKNAPYHKEHEFANKIENMLLKELEKRY